MALVDLYRGSVQSFMDRVALIRADQWDNATPCTDWNVRALVNHVVYEQLWSVPLFAGATIAEVGDRFEGDVLGADPVKASIEAGEAAQTAVSQPGVMERIVHLSFGDTPAEEYVSQLFADHLIHGWDLAVGRDADRTLDPAAVSALRDWFDKREGMYRGAGIIADRVDVPADSSAQDRLIAAFGRDPRS
jgi:uncharacterized protein (TIGR03086 family)